MAATSIWHPDAFDVASLIAPPEWMKDSACSEAPGAEFFPERGASTAPAKAVCARCIVRFECLDYAVAGGIVWGIWGGLSPQERRRQRTAAA